MPLYISTAVNPGGSVPHLVKRGVPIAISGVQLGAFREKQHDHGEVPEAASEMERRVSDSARHVQPFPEKNAYYGIKQTKQHPQRVCKRGGEGGGRRRPTVNMWACMVYCGGGGGISRGSSRKFPSSSTGMPYRHDTKR